MDCRLSTILRREQIGQPMMIIAGMLFSQKPYYFHLLVWKWTKINLFFVILYHEYMPDLLLFYAIGILFYILYLEVGTTSLVDNHSAA